MFGQSSSLEPDAAYYNDPVDDLSADFAGLKSASKYTIDSTLESSAVTALSDAPENANKTVYDSKLDPSENPSVSFPWKTFLTRYRVRDYIFTI